MAAILIVTLGTSDINIDKSFIEALASETEMSTLYHPKTGRLLARPIGEFILKHYDKLKKEVVFPILSPCFNFLKKNEIPSKVILVVTNQEHPIFSKQDTIHYAEIVKRLIPERLDKSVEVEKIIQITDNVTFLDNMYDWFGQVFNKKPLNHLSSFDTIYLLNQGGIDAINTALLLQIIPVAGDKLVHLAVSEQTYECHELEFSLQFMQQNEKIKLKSFVEQYDYAAIKTLNTASDIKNIAQYAQARLHFDFDSALLACQRISREQRSFQVKFINELNAITGEEQDSLIRELYSNAVIKVRQESYVDFLLRIFRITEHIAKSEVLKIMNISHKQYDFRKWSSTIEDFVIKPENIDLKVFLDNYKLGNDSLDRSMANIKVFISILKYYNHSTLSILLATEALSQMRNKSIGAHDFQPVSRVLIEKKLEEHDTNLNQLLDEIGQFLNCQNNPFDEINKKILSLL